MFVNELNILLTSVGRRSYLVNYFKAALGNRGKVHVSNSSDISPAFQVADFSVVTPLIYDSDYIPFLLEYCKKNRIGAIISLFDIDLPILARNKEKFASIGTKVIVSDEKVISVCNDKWKSFQFLQQNGFRVPETYLYIEQVIDKIARGELNYPVIVKPRWGMGSISIYEAENEEELVVFYNKVKRNIANTYLKYEAVNDIDNCVIVQEKIVGQEYGLDVINDLEGNYQTTIVKKKYAMRSGETDCAVTIYNEKLKELGEQVSSSLHHIANLDVDIFLAKDNIYILEMNARFGGGYPFSHMAGVNLPLAIVKWLEGEKSVSSLLLERTNVMYHKDIKLVPVINQWELYVDKEPHEELIYKAVIELEKYLQPSLLQRKVNIKKYVNKLYQYGVTRIIYNRMDEAIGIVGMYMNNLETRTAYLSLLIIHDKYRGVHLAEKHLREMEIDAKYNGMKKSRLEVHKDNPIAIRFYMKLGYKIISDASVECYYMEKDL